MRRLCIGAVLLFVMCLLPGEEASAMMWGKKNAPKKPEQQLVEQEAIKLEVDKTLKDATSETREKYVLEQIKNLNHRQAYQRKLAMYRFLYSGEPAMAHLSELLNDKNERVRMSAIILVGKFGSVEQLETVFDLFVKAPNKRTREVARYALFGLASAKPQFFIDQLKTEDPEVLSLLMNALDAAYEKASPDLEKAFRTSENEAIRKNAGRIIGAYVCDKMDGMIAADRMFLYAYGLSGVRFTPEQIKETAEKSGKLTDIELEVVIAMATDQNVRVYERRMALVVLGCLPQERAATALIKPVRESSVDAGALIHVLGWNAHPLAGKFLCEIFVDSKYANMDSLIAESLVANPGKEIDADLRKMFSDKTTSEELRVKLAHILAMRHDEGSLELMLAQVTDKKVEVVAQYLPAIACYGNPPAQDFFLNLWRNPQTDVKLRLAAMNYLVLQRNRAVIDGLLSGYDGLSKEEKDVFYQSAFQLVQTQPDKERCLTVVMFLLPKVDGRQAWQVLAPLNNIVPKNDLVRYINSSNKSQAENYTKELQKIMDWWEQNRKEEKYNFPVAAPVKP